MMRTSRIFCEQILKRCIACEAGNNTCVPLILDDTVIRLIEEEGERGNGM